MKYQANHYYFQIIPFLLRNVRGILPSTTKCFLLLLQWYVVAVRTKEHDFNTMATMDELSIR